MIVHVAIKMSSSSPNSVYCITPNAFQSPRLPIMYGDTSLFAGELLQTIQCTHARTLAFLYFILSYIFKYVYNSKS